MGKRVPTFRDGRDLIEELADLAECVRDLYNRGLFEAESPLEKSGNTLHLPTQDVIRRAKVVTTWTGGNTVTVHPCNLPDGSDADTGTTLTLEVDTPSSASPVGLAINAGDVVKFIPNKTPSGADGNLLSTTQSGPADATGFYARITASHKVTGKNEWLYDAHPAAKNDGGVDVAHYTVDAGTSLTGLVNLSESGNLAVFPVPTGTVVWVTPRTLGDSTVENQFIYEESLVGTGSSNGDMLFWNATDTAWEAGAAIVGLPASTAQGDFLVGDNAGGWILLAPPAGNGDYLATFTAGVWTFTAASIPPTLVPGSGIHIDSVSHVISVLHDPSLTFTLAGGVMNLGVGDLSFIGGVAGVHVTPLAKLTVGGTNGSLTFTNGLLTGGVDPT